MPGDHPIVDPDGHVLHAPSPAQLATEVYPGVWLGGSFTRYDRTYPIFGVDLEVCLPGEGHRPRARQLVQAGFLDGPDIPENLPQLAAVVTDAVAANEKILVRCYTGQNRSALVLTVALCVLRLQPAAGVIADLRARRSRHVLCNPAFERYLIERYPS